MNFIRDLRFASQAQTSLDSLARTAICDPQASGCRLLALVTSEA
jgi:hypothetical protein